MKVGGCSDPRAHARPTRTPAPRSMVIRVPPESLDIGFHRSAPTQRAWSMWQAPSRTDRDGGFKMLTKLLMLGVALAGLIVFAACNSQTEQAPTQQAPTGLFGSSPDYYGVAPIEETIAWADVIARVQLLSVTAVADQKTGQTTDYIAALDYRFRVLEYLRVQRWQRACGGVPMTVWKPFASSGSAVTRAQALKDNRDTQWDSREAIIFLR